jgi:hypothetical protein
VCAQAEVRACDDGPTSGRLHLDLCTLSTFASSNYLRNSSRYISVLCELIVCAVNQDQYKFLYDAVAFLLALSMKRSSSSSVTREEFERMTDDSEYSNGMETYAEQTAVVRCYSFMAKMFSHL